jgi:hypothetical protein
VGNLSRIYLTGSRSSSSAAAAVAAKRFGPFGLFRTPGYVNRSFHLSMVNLSLFILSRYLTNWNQLIVRLIINLKESGFCSLSIALCFLKKHNVSETASSGKITVAPTLLGPLKTDSLNHWTSFRNVVYLEKTLDDGQSP